MFVIGNKSVEKDQKKKIHRRDKKNSDVTLLFSMQSIPLQLSFILLVQNNPQNQLGDANHKSIFALMKGRLLPAVLA